MSPAIARDGRSASGRSDGYTLAVSWSPEYCRGTERRARRCPAMLRPQRPLRLRGPRIVARIARRRLAAVVPHARQAERRRAGAQLVHDSVGEAAGKRMDQARRLHDQPPGELLQGHPRPVEQPALARFRPPRRATTRSPRARCAAPSPMPISTGSRGTSAWSSTNAAGSRSCASATARISCPPPAMHAASAPKDAAAVRIWRGL